MNIGQFVPALPNTDDWEKGLMDRILPSLLKIQQGFHGTMSANITQQRLEAIALIEAMCAKEELVEESNRSSMKGPRKLLEVLRNHPEADRLWYNTLAAFPDCTVEELLEKANKGSNLYLF